jgi:peptidoglycan hydrolase-like protein with peptidoglycan-binding domain
MTPRQAQLALLSFAVLALGVAFNALVLQEKAIVAQAKVEKVPARPAADRGRKGHEMPASRNGSRSSSIVGEEPSLRIARFAPDSAKFDARLDVPEDETDSETISAIQRELKQRGYGPLPGDGLLRPATRAAIMAFEHDQGLPLTGEASVQTLKRILLGASASGSAPGAGKVRSVHAQEMIRGVQKSLIALGYQLSIDGQLGEDTVKAIREFEMDKGRVPTGRLSAELLTRLAEATAQSKR